MKRKALRFVPIKKNSKLIEIELSHVQKKPFFVLLNILKTNINDGYISFQVSSKLQYVHHHPLDMIAESSDGRFVPLC